MAGDELVPADEQLRFEAIYFGVIAALGAAVLAVRFGPRAQEAGLAILAAAGAAALSLAFSVANRPERPRRDRAQRMLPLVMLLALLTIAADRTATALAAGALAGLAAAPLMGYLAIRRSGP